MKKIVSFEKELNFPSMIGLITSIALDHNLKFISKNEIEGNFIVSGTYKMTEASTLEEDFKYDIPVSISLTEQIDINSAIISIDDFHYEIVNEDRLNCKIDLLVNAIEEIDLELEEVRECDGDHQQKIKEQIEEIEQKEEKIEEKIEVQSSQDNNVEKSIDILQVNEEGEDNTDEGTEKNISSLFDSFSNDDETFTTYSVYIYRKDDTLENIITKYNTNMDDLSNYNDLSNIEIGSKIIIPNTSNE